MGYNVYRYWSLRGWTEYCQGVIRWDYNPPENVSMSTVFRMKQATSYKNLRYFPEGNIARWDYTLTFPAVHAHSCIFAVEKIWA